MISVNTNITSLVVQNHFTLANSCLQTSIERLSTGFKINRAADDAANLSVSKNMECQISGSKVALDNAQQAINLVQTADSAMGEMQDIAQRIRELAVQAANGTYSDKERAMMQEEVTSLVNEIYQQRNGAKFNEIKIFGAEEVSPRDPSLQGSNATASARHPELVSGSQADSTNPANPSVDAVSTPPPID